MTDDLATKNLTITQRQQITPAGAVLRLVDVSFMLGAHGPFTLTIPADQFTAAETNKRIADLRTQIAAIS